jgi:hypothetical protein
MATAHAHQEQQNRGLLFGPAISAIDTATVVRGSIHYKFFDGAGHASRRREQFENGSIGCVV